MVIFHSYVRLVIWVLFLTPRILGTHNNTVVNRPIADCNIPTVIYIYIFRISSLWGCNLQFCHLERNLIRSDQIFQLFLGRRWVNTMMNFRILVFKLGNIQFSPSVFVRKSGPPWFPQFLMLGKIVVLRQNNDIFMGGETNFQTHLPGPLGTVFHRNSVI